MIALHPRRAIGLAVYVAVVLWLTWMPASELSRLRVNSLLLDMAHIPLFGGLALLAFWSVIGPFRVRIVTVAVSCVSFAALDEWAQRFAPRRVPTLEDFAADCAGIGLGLALGLVFNRGSVAAGPESQKGGSGS